MASRAPIGQRAQPVQPIRRAVPPNLRPSTAGRLLRCPIGIQCRSTGHTHRDPSRSRRPEAATGLTGRFAQSQHPAGARSDRRRHDPRNSARTHWTPPASFVATSSKEPPFGRPRRASAPRPLGGTDRPRDTGTSSDVEAATGPFRWLAGNRAPGLTLARGLVQRHDLPQPRSRNECPNLQPCNYPRKRGLPPLRSASGWPLKTRLSTAGRHAAM
jgi:hypothetical protein